MTSSVPVLYEDHDLLAVAKPAGVLVVRGREGASEPSLLDELMKSRHEKTLLAVHRLDRDTSGVLLFARTKQAQRTMTAQFEAGDVKKRYLALLKGAPPDEHFTVAVALMPARRGKSRPVSPGEQGKPSQTEFKVLERFGEVSFVEARPKTGRTHQIRVHARFVGHPLVVDPHYGRTTSATWRALGVDADGVALERTPLHAAELSLPHPTTGQPLKIEAPLPGDLVKVLERLRQSAGAKI